MTHLEHTLLNGLRIVFQPTKTIIGHCALLINTGSRDEEAHEHGMAHFIEHNLFKGTKRRKAYHILSRLDDVGGELNAYTTKEETVIHTSFLVEHYDRALELIADILLNSTFPEKELKKEKDVIRDEIHSYLDNPSESIFDDFENAVFAGHPMGKSILGTEESLESFTREMVQDFISKNYNPHKMVLCVSGPVAWTKLNKMIDKYFSNITFNGKANGRIHPADYHVQKTEEQKELMQTHAIIGNRAVDLHSEQFIPMVLLNNLLGGPGMNSRLNLNIREKYGFAYNLESFYSPYTDTGVFGVYLGTHKDDIEKSLNLVKKELRLLCDKKLGVVQLNKAQKQLIGQVALSQENNLSLIIALGKSLLNYNRIDTIEDVYARISQISAEDVLEIANTVFDPKQLSTLLYKAR